MKEIIKFFDCFAGIGGFHCGASQIHSDQYTFNHVAYCEIDDTARKLYDQVCTKKGVQVISDVTSIRTHKNPDGIEVNYV